MPATIKAVHDCRICGSSANLNVTQPDESMHSGWASVHCGKCSNAVMVKAEHMSVARLPGDTGWGVIFRQLRAAEQEAVCRWNLLNTPPTPMTPEQVTAYQRGQAKAYIEPFVRIDMPSPISMDIGGLMDIMERAPAALPYRATTDRFNYECATLDGLYDEVWQRELSGRR